MDLGEWEEGARPGLFAFHIGKERFAGGGGGGRGSLHERQGLYSAS